METDYGLNILASSFVEVATNNAYNFGEGDFTITALFQTSLPGTLLSRKSAQDGSAEYAGWVLSLENNGVIKIVTNNGLGYYTLTSIATTALDNTWHSVAVTRQSGTISVYFDGNTVNTVVSSNLPTPLNISNNMPLLMGYTYQTQEPNPQFIGVIEDITIWNRALSPEEIDDTIFNNVQVTSPGLVGFWEMNKNFTDSSPINNTGIPFGSVYFIPIYHCVWVEGVNNYSYCSIDMHEDVDDDFGVQIAATGEIIIPTNNVYNFGLNDFSLTALFQTSQAGTIISRKSTTESGPTDAGWSLVLEPDGSFKMKTDSGTGYYGVASVATTALNGYWHSIGAIRQGGSITIYFDGSPISCTPYSSIPGPLNVSSSTRVLIGNCDQQSEPYKQFIGVIEDVTIWNIAISINEIQLSRFNGLTGSENGLVGFWKMDNNFSDASPTQNTGSSSGAVTFTKVHHPASRRQSLNITAGTQFLYGGILDKELNDGTFPAGSKLIVYKPDGTVLSPNNDPDQLVFFYGDSVQAFTIKNPDPGNWIFSLQSPTNIPLLFNAQTVPSNEIAQTITTSLEQVYSSPPASHVRFLSSRSPERLTSFTLSWADVALWAGVGIATVALAVVLAPVVTGVAITASVMYATTVALGVGAVLVQMGLTGQISNAAHQASYQIGVGSASGGGSKTGNYTLVLDGSNYFPLLRNLLMAVQTGSYSVTGKQPPVQPTFENMFKAVSDAGKNAYVMMFDTSAIYHMIENSDILKFYPRQIWTGNDGRDNYKSRDALKKYKNINVCLESYTSSASNTPLYSQHSKLAVFSVNGVKTALVGGFNITPTYWDDADHPMHDHNNFHAWHDSAVLLQGSIVDEVEKEFDRRWLKANFDKAPSNQNTYVKFSCYHVKHDTCLDGPNNCSTTNPSSIPYTNPLSSDPVYPVDVLITSSEYEEKYTQIKDKILQQINLASSYVYFENFTFHDLDIVNALVNKVKSAPSAFICIINLPYPTNGADTLDQSGQFYMIRLAFATMLINTGQWTQVALDGGTIITKNQCSAYSVTFETGKGIEYALFNYTINGTSTSVALGPSLINVIQATVSNFVFTSGVRYFQTLNPNDQKFQLPGLNINFRTIYDHSKLALFDDTYAIIGSANFNSRSLTFDGECAVGVNSLQKVTAIRQTLFTHWGMDTPSNWNTKMQSYMSAPVPGVCAVPLSIRVLSSAPVPWYWKYASFIYEFSDLN